MSTAVELLRCANALAQRGELEQAVACFRSLLAVRPDWPEALSNLGNALREMGRIEEAVPVLEQALRRRAAFPEALINLGAALEERGELERAEETFQHALVLCPACAPAHNNLGSVLQKQGRMDEALVHLQEALRLQPELADAHHNLGVVRERMGLVEQAIGSYRQALRLRPDFAEAHVDLGLALLLTGDFTRGWEEYEWRWRTRRVIRRNFPQPPWDGSPLAGRTILIHAEQGLGDTVQFLRYLPLMRDAEIILEVPPALEELARGVTGAARIVPAGSPLPRFDCHAPLLSLPRLFHTTVDTVPNEVPYLRVNALADRPAAEGRYRIGIAWAGNPAHVNDRARSMRLADLAPLGAVPGVSLFSLQKGPAARQPGLSLQELVQQTCSVEETAAAILHLDLVISVDTLIAHLAGALGKPVWTLLAFASDWRWLRSRQDSPWYPTMRLFRQPRPGDWKSVAERVAASLEEEKLCHPSIS